MQIALFGICLSLLNVLGTARNNSTEYDLHDKLFTGYNVNVMPICNRTKGIDIGLEMYLLSIENIDEKKQTISIRAFLELTWKDQFLQWDPRDYDNASRMNLDVQDIWVPDLALRYTFGKPTDIGQDKGNAVVTFDGNVTIWPYKMYTVACQISVLNFPFDKQSCQFEFLSWTRPTSALRLRTSTGVLHIGRYLEMESGEWDLLKSNVLYNQTEYGNDTWDIVTYKLKLQRKPLYHILNIMLPVFSISALNMICFILPVKSGERVSLSISVFLTLAIFLTTINNFMPESSDEFARIGLFVTFQLSGSVFTVVFTVLSLYLFHCNFVAVGRPFHYLIKLACMTPDKDEYDLTSRRTTGICNSVFTTYLNTDNNSDSNGSNHIMESFRSSQPIDETDLCDSKQVAWIVVSNALDRICFVASLCWTILSISVLLINLLN